ncbi:MAG: carboxypeptidase regulatory-like domain-containing protein [Verrucomicrobia bacterium]|nr:MAG: carboxypeptidase regulatory-like domain-containing protein [Verrucomicrobiota bacterium]
MKSNTGIASGSSRTATEVSCASLMTGVVLFLASWLLLVGAGCASSKPQVRQGGPRAEPLMLELGSYLQPFEQSGQPVTYYDSIKGDQVFDGLPFRISGQALLFGRASVESRGESHPKSLENIPIGRKFDQLDLIHYAKWPDTDGNVIAKIRLNYADGSHREFPIVYGGHVRDWKRFISEEREVMTDTNSKICWRGPGSRLGRQTTTRLFKSVFANPRPDKLVKSMDVVSTEQQACYGLIAATVADNDPTRRSPPPIAWMKDQPFDGQLRVRVVDQDTGKPVPSVAGRAYLIFPDDDRGYSPVFYTGEDGSGVVRYPTGQLKSVLLELSRDGYTGKQISWQSGSIPEMVTTRLKAGTPGEIGGVVVNDAGQPVPDAHVTFSQFNFGDTEGESTHIASLATRTDAHGRWVLRGIPKGFQDFGVNIQHTNFPRTSFVTEHPAEHGLTGQLVASVDFWAEKAVLQLSGGCSLTGTVRLSPKQPATNATIFVGIDRYAAGVVRATTDAQGNFTLKNLRPAENYFTISAPGREPEFLTLTITKTNEPLDLTLKPGRLIKGRVTGRFGNPIPGVEISFSGLSELENNPNYFKGRTLEWSTKTDEAGRFEWESAPQKAFGLDISKPGFMARRWETVPAETRDEIIVHLAPPLRIRGLVKDEETGQPIAHFTVTPGLPNAADPHAPNLQNGLVRGFSGGQYDLSYESPLFISSTPHDFVFQFAADGYLPFLSPPFKAGEGEVVFDVALKRFSLAR